MTKTLVIAIVMSVASTAYASHPHQAVCVVAVTQPDGDLIQFLLQTEVSREYVSGNPDNDVHDFRYQVRVCDDDNEGGHCSTYESKAIVHAASAEVTLVGMKDKSAVFFRGHFIGDSMEGSIVHRGRHGKTLVPFTAKLDQCIAQSWVKLAREADSNGF